MKNKYYEADVSIFVSSDLVSSNIRIPPVGAIIYYTDKELLTSDTNTEKGTKEFIGRLDNWRNSHTTKPLVRSLLENQNDLKVLLESEEPDSEDVRLIVVESFVSEDIKSATLNWALSKGKCKCKCKDNRNI